MARASEKKLVSWCCQKSQEGKWKHTIPTGLHPELAQGHSYLPSIDKSQSQALAPWHEKMHPTHILLTGAAKPHGKGRGYEILMQEIRKDGK